MRKVTSQSWYEIPMPNTFIAWVNALSQGQPNGLEFFDRKKHPIGELEIIGLGAGKTEALHIELLETETDFGPVLFGA